jgi:hypothetical protein
MQLLYSQPHSNIFHGHFFLKKPLQRGQGAPTLHLRRKELTQFIGKLGKKNLTTARFINGLLGGKPEKKT